MEQTDNPTNIIVVLGTLTNEDGSPTEMMKSRIKRAAELYTSLKQQNIDCRVIVTGYQAPDQVTDSCPKVPITFSIIIDIQRLEVEPRANQIKSNQIKIKSNSLKAHLPRE